MKAELIRPLLLATTKVLDRLTSGPCIVGRPSVTKELRASTDSLDVIIRLSGSVDGAMILRFPQATAVEIVHVFHGTAWDGSNVSDGMAEIARTIERVVRRQASEEGIWPAGPIVRLTPANASLELDDTPWLTSHVKSPVGGITFAVSLKQVATQPAAQPAVAEHRVARPTP